MDNLSQIGNVTELCEINFREKGQNSRKTRESLSHESQSVDISF